MTGVELYIKDNNFVYCYKQRHDGYWIEDFINEKGDEIFNMSAEDIIHSFHNEKFLEYNWSNFHANGTPLEYGIKVPIEKINSNNFEELVESVYQYIDIFYHDDYNENNDYRCGYGDWMVYIDLITKSIEGIDD